MCWSISPENSIVANTLDGATIQTNKEVRMVWSYVMETMCYIYIYDMRCLLSVWWFVSQLHYTIQPQAIISAVSPYSLLQANEAWRQQFLGSVAAEQVGEYACCLSLCVLVIFDECVCHCHCGDLYVNICSFSH